MKNLKHVGKVKNTGTKVIIVFRTLPGEAHQALVVQSNNLPDSYHNSLMELIEKDEAQSAYEFGEILFVRHFPDGRPMLQALQADGRLQKVATDQIITTPNPQVELPLDQLNVLIAEQKNCTIDDLASFVKGAAPVEKKPVQQPAPQQMEVVEDATTVKNDAPLSDSDLAKSYRSQADALYKEAAQLRKQADELDPPKKKATKEKVAESV
jgi:hypothetical protein